jgi:hypothetical protein
MLIEQEGQDGRLGLAVSLGGGSGVGQSPIRRVLISHEERASLWSGSRLAFARRREPLLGAGSHYRSRCGRTLATWPTATGPVSSARGPTYV